MGLLSDKVAVITGAGRGIGRATALLFAQEGASVVVNDLGVQADGTGPDPTVAKTVANEIGESGGKAIAHGGDISRNEDVESLFSEAVERFGRVDIVVNCAGILRDKSLLRIDEAAWRAVLETHLTGTFHCTQIAARIMKGQGGTGRIINTTSVAGMLGNYGQANYAAAEAGIYGLTRTASIELQRYGIRVNAVAPLAKTRLTEDLPIFEKVSSMTPEHAAPVYLFLASDLAADITGQVVGVSGGRVSSYKVIESQGKFKGGDGIWTAAEIADNWVSIGKS